MFEDKQYDEAFDLVKKSVTAYPDKENHYLRALLAVTEFDEYDMAIESAQYCLDQKYKIPQCYQILATAYYGQEKWDESIGMWNKVLDNDRKNVRAYYYRGHSYERMGDKENALKDFNAGLKFEGVSDINFVHFYNDIAYIYMDKGDYQTAEKYLNKALELGHSSGNFLDSYGELMYKKGNYKECLRYMGAAIVQGKKTEADWLENSYYYRGLANKKLGFDADAYEDLLRAVELENEDAKLALNELFVINNNQKSGRYFNLFRTPKFKSNKTSNLKLKAIETTEEATRLYFTCGQAGGGWLSINENSYIIEKNSKTKLYLIDAEGIAISPERTEFKNNLVSFILSFPSVSEECVEIDFIEEVSKDEQGWSIKGIVLKDNYSANGDLYEIHWEDVVVSDDVKHAEGLIAVKSITETSSWGGNSVKLGIQNCIKGIQVEAAKKGCCMAIITDIERGAFYTNVTATIYKRP